MTIPIILKADSLYFKREQKLILDEVSLVLKKSDFHVILGPNGAGKSSLIKILSGELHPSSGNIKLHGKELKEYTLKDLAKCRSVLPQLSSFIFPLTAYEVCALGRTPYMGPRLNEQDKKLIDESLLAVDMKKFANQEYASLSGGEQQRVQIARILCQNTELLLLDEPFAALDIHHQIQLMELLKRLRDEGKTILCVMHDINLALRYAASLTFLKEGKVVFQGETSLANKSALYKEVYGVDVNIDQHEKGFYQVVWS